MSFSQTITTTHIKVLNALQMNLDEKRKAIFQHCAVLPFFRFHRFRHFNAPGSNYQFRGKVTSKSRRYSFFVFSLASLFWILYQFIQATNLQDYKTFLATDKNLRNRFLPSSLGFVLKAQGNLPHKREFMSHWYLTSNGTIFPSQLLGQQPTIVQAR